MSGRITPGKSLIQLKQDAKRWLKALRTGVAAARQRFYAALPEFDGTPTLRDVQHALARELGYPGWTALKQAVSADDRAGSGDGPEALVARFLDNACPDHHVRGGSDHARASATAMRLLQRHPAIATASLATRVVCGDREGVAGILASDPGAVGRRDGEPTPQRAGSGSADDLIRRDWGPKGWTPLLYLAFTRLPLAASSDQAVAIARLLLDAGADPTVHFMAGNSRYTPLVGVIGEGEEGRPPHPRRDELVALLLERGAHPFDSQVLYNIHFGGEILWFLRLIHRSTVEGGSAAVWDDPAWPMLDLWGHGNGARWILELAVRHDDAELARWCLEQGADAGAPPPPRPGTAWLSGTLYEEALRHGSARIAELLMAHGAVATEVALAPAEALTAAALSGDPPRVRDLVARHPSLRNDAGPLIAAAQRNRLDALALLLDAGLDVNATRTDGETALHHAVYRRHPEAARVLLERGADVDIRGRNYGNTPYSTTVYSRERELMALLAPHSRDIWELVFGGQVARVRVLLEERPELARVAGDGQTLLHWLTPDDEAIALETARLLLAHGADPAVPNPEGMTAAHRAERIGMLELAALLRQGEGGPGASRPVVADYEAMALRLLEAYRTGAPEAMERHYADTWHRRAWSGMRSYVLADLGIHHEPGSELPDITLDDARRWVAYDHQFRSWEELVAYLDGLPPTQRSVTRSPVGARRVEPDDDDRVLARDWDQVIEAILARGYPVVHANGQMTDAVLGRIAAIPEVTALHLGGSKQLTDAGLAALAGMPQLRYLDISGTGVTDAGLRVLAQLPNLEQLKGDGLRISDASGAALAACPRLAQVDLLWTGTGDGIIAAFAGHPALRHLTTGVSVTDAGLVRLADIPRYRSWSFDEASADKPDDRGPASVTLRGTFTDRGLASLARLEGLSSLYYESRGAVSAEGLAQLAAMPHLGALSGEFGDAEMPVIGSLPVLRRLGCQDTDATDDGWVALAASRTIEAIWGRRCHGLGARGFKALASMPALANLSVSCLNVPDDAVALLPGFPALRELMPMDIPDAGYRHIGKCQRLEKLTLMYCRETGDQATGHITGLDRLRRYFASYTRITDRTPQLLATMRGLEEIEFSAISGITDAGVAALAAAPALRRLSVDGSPRVTPAVLERFPARIRVRVT